MPGSYTPRRATRVRSLRPRRHQPTRTRLNRAGCGHKPQARPWESTAKRCPEVRGWRIPGQRSERAGSAAAQRGSPLRRLSGRPGPAQPPPARASNGGGRLLPPRPAPGAAPSPQLPAAVRGRAGSGPPERWRELRASATGEGCELTEGW